MLVLVCLWRPQSAFCKSNTVVWHLDLAFVSPVGAKLTVFIVDFTFEGWGGRVFRVGIIGLVLPLLDTHFDNKVQRCGLNAAELSSVLHWWSKGISVCSSTCFLSFSVLFLLGRSGSFGATCVCHSNRPVQTEFLRWHFFCCLAAVADAARVFLYLF